MSVLTSLILVALVAGLVLVVVVWRAANRRLVLEVGVAEHAAIADIARHTRRWRLAGAVLGVVAAGLVAQVGDRALGRVLMLAPLALGAGALLGVALGELTARTPRGLTRTAVLTRRTVGGLWPSDSRSRVLVGLVLAGSVLSLGAALGSPDDLGRPGRTLARACTQVIDGVPAVVTSTRGPWPGSYYVVPAGLALLVALVLAAVAARAAAARQRPSSTDAALDDQLRRWSVMSVASALDATLRLTAGPLALAMSVILLTSQCAGGADRTLGWGLVLLGVLALATGLTSLLEVFAGPRVVVDDRPRPVPPAATQVPVR